MTTVEDLNVAPGSIVEVRDEEWLVTSAECGSDGWLVQVQGLSELVAGTSASFYSSLDSISVLDPAHTTGLLTVPPVTGTPGCGSKH